MSKKIFKKHMPKELSNWRNNMHKVLESLKNYSVRTRFIMRRRSESSSSNTHKKSTDWSANTRKLSKTTLQRFVNSMSRRIRNSQPPSAVSSKSTQARCQNLKKSTQQL